MDAKPQDYFVTLARSAFAAVPWIGGALNEVAFDHRSRIKQRRFEAFVGSVASEVERLGQGAVRREFLASEEFSDLLEAVLRRAVLAAGAEKRDRLRAILVNHLTGQRPTDYQDLFLDLAMEVTEKEVEILGAFNAAAARPRDKEDTPLAPNQEPFRSASQYGLDDESFRFAVQHLIARGLFFDDGIGRFDTSALEVVEITEMGRRFVEFLTSSAERPGT